LGAIRFRDLGDGRRLAEHDGKGDPLHPRWEEVYPVEEIDGETVLRCVIVTHLDNWEVGVTEDGYIVLGEAGHLYSMPIAVAKKIDNLLGPAIPDAEALVEERKKGRGGVGGSFTI